MPPLNSNPKLPPAPPTAEEILAKHEKARPQSDVADLVGVYVKDLERMAAMTAQILDSNARLAGTLDEQRIRIDALEQEIDTLKTAQLHG